MIEIPIPGHELIYDRQTIEAQIGHRSCIGHDRPVCGYYQIKSTKGTVTLPA